MEHRMLFTNSCARCLVTNIAAKVARPIWLLLTLEISGDQVSCHPLHQLWEFYECPRLMSVRFTHVSFTYVQCITWPSRSERNIHCYVLIPLGWGIMQWWPLSLCLSVRLSLSVPCLILSREQNCIGSWNLAHDRCHLWLHLQIERSKVKFSRPSRIEILAPVAAT